MNANVKSAFGNIHQKIKILSAAFTCFIGITLFFIFSDVMTNFIGSFLRVDSSYTGGATCAEFVGDAVLVAKDSSLMRYTVHQPVTNARWQKSSEYWQLVLEYRDGKTVSENTNLFIALDNNEGLPAVCDFTVCLNNGEGKIFDKAGQFLSEVEYYTLNNGSLIKIRIPLSDKRLQKILGAKKTYHYIKEAGLSKSESTPLEVTMTAKKQNKKEEAKNQAFVNEVKELYYQSRSQQGGEPDFNDTNSALEYYRQKIKENPEDYESLAYYGSWLAMKGGQSSVMKALSLVNEAYTYLDKACELAYEKDGEIDVLMNRASVSASVPEQVFGRAEGGAADFMRIVLLSEEPLEKAYAYVMAYDCYKKSGKESQAFLALQEAKKMLE